MQVSTRIDSLLGLLLAHGCLLAACGGALTPGTGTAGTSGMTSIGGVSGGDVGNGGDVGSVGAGGAVGVGGSISIGGAVGTGGRGGGGAVGPLGANCPDCLRMPFGSPAWEPAGAVVFFEPVGGGLPDLPWMQNMMAPGHVRRPEVGAFGPGLAHAGPYEYEPVDLVTTAGSTPSQNFVHHTIATLSSSVGFLLAIVPDAGAVKGTSADFDYGRIIPNALFPMHVTVAMDPPLFDPGFDAAIPGNDSFEPPIEADGMSHALVHFRISEAYLQPPAVHLGAFLLNVTITDASGSGWTVGFLVRIGPDEVP